MTLIWNREIILGKHSKIQQTEVLQTRLPNFFMANSQARYRAGKRTAREK